MITKFSSRKIEKATYEDLGYRYVSGGLHPDHATIANFRKTFLPELYELFVEILLLAKLAGVLKIGNLSLDGSKILILPDFVVSRKDAENRFFVHGINGIFTEKSLKLRIFSVKI